MTGMQTTAKSNNLEQLIGTKWGVETRMNIKFSKTLPRRNFIKLSFVLTHTFQHQARLFVSGKLM